MTFNFDMIDSNPNGLSSSEFFRVCGDLVSAMEYLHKMKLVHRDIKPGNIVISKCCDGKSIYKVADFGAARTLRPNQHYSSLYGTYEYVHPDIFVNFYRQALDIAPTVKVFNETHEMWSVGVTLYETATGKLPFKPKSGREDCKTMYKMTSAKQHGQISATEEKDGIEWSRELPQSCMIEQKDDVTRFLAGLLEVRSFCQSLFSQWFFIMSFEIGPFFQTSNMWSFERFSNETSFLKSPTQKAKLGKKKHHRAKIIQKQQKRCLVNRFNSRFFFIQFIFILLRSRDVIIDKKCTKWFYI